MVGCVRHNAFSALGDCRVKAAHSGQNTDSDEIVKGCMQSKGYRIDFSLKGCSPDPSNPAVYPSPIIGNAGLLFHPNPKDDRCYAKGAG